MLCFNKIIYVTVPCTSCGVVLLARNTRVAGLFSLKNEKTKN